jgi:transcriptional regulator GlxA family with amidase domain
MTDLINLKRTENFSSKYGSSRSKLNASLSYLQSHYKEALSIEQAAEICHLSKCYFIKVFKAYTGQTPYDYLLQLRLHQAQRLLVETSLSVGDIAQETGFNDDKNFIACFKNKIGQTPLQYRKQNRYG